MAKILDVDVFVDGRSNTSLTVTLQGTCRFIELAGPIR
jgi:hypothetical protein